MKLKVFIIILIIFTLVAVGIALWQSSSDEVQILSPEDSKTAIVTGPRGEVEIADVFSKPEFVIPGEGMYILRNDQFTIFFDEDTKRFHISLQAQPIEDVRKDAERTFLDKLQIDKDDACKLAVNLSGPISLDERFGRVANYGLSFCPNGIEFPPPLDERENE